MLPRAPTLKKGLMHLNEAPGWSVDLDESAAKRFPLPDTPGSWEPVRRNHGTRVRP